ncbi:MAG: TauD/TfdA family dioxygenase [Pseudomonadota bacterium]
MCAVAVQELPVPGQQQFGELFPLALGPAEAVDLNAAIDYARQSSDELLGALSRHGAILFRGFPIGTAEEFDAFLSAFGMESFTYEESLSNAVRVNKTDKVFTANEAPPDVSIFLHHEMAQTPLFPSRLFFCCLIAPERDGATPLCRSDVLLEQLQHAEPEFVRQCEELGVRYSNVMPGNDDPTSGQGRSWRSTLGVESVAEAEARLAALGYRHEWLPGEVLRATTPVLPAVRALLDGRRVFFNQLIAAFRGWQDTRNDPRKSICFGDDSPIDEAAMNTAIALSDELSFDLNWQAGDVALVDNYLVMHGRRPFTGKRSVLASLVADDGTRLVA